MPLRTDESFRAGLRVFGNRSGLQLVLLFVLVRLLGLAAADTVTRANRLLLESTEVPPPQADLVADLMAVPTPFALEASLPAAIGLWLAAALAAEAVHIAAIRTVAGGHEAGVPRSALGRRIGRATLSGFVAGVLVVGLVGLGLVLLVVPGLFVATALYFVRQEVALEDESALTALAASWERTAGNRLQVLGLAVVVTGINLSGVVAAGVLEAIGPAGSALIAVSISAVTTVFAVAAVTDAFGQLRVGAPAEPSGDEPVGALDADDLEDFDWDA